MQSHTKKWQRITIWIIAITLAVGTLGSYFAIMLANDQSAQEKTEESATQLENDVKKEQTVDPDAYKVSGKVTQLQIVDLKEGAGEPAKATDKVRVHYKGTVAQTGVKFDSSYDNGEPITFGLDGVIEGWTKGVPGMKVGGKRRLVVPSAMAYGETGAPPVIEPNTDLVFEIELLAINPAE